MRKDSGGLTDEVIAACMASSFRMIQGYCTGLRSRPWPSLDAQIKAEIAEDWARDEADRAQSRRLLDHDTQNDPEANEAEDETEEQDNTASNIFLSGYDTFGIAVKTFQPRGYTSQR